MDRRQHARFDLSGRVLYSWSDTGGVRCAARGVTRDVSECGLYIRADSLPAAGTRIRFEVSFSFGDDSEITMRARGKVLRTEPHGDQKVDSGFAAATKKIWFGKSERSPEREFLKLF